MLPEYTTSEVSEQTSQEMIASLESIIDRVPTVDTIESAEELFRHSGATFVRREHANVYSNPNATVEADETSMRVLNYYGQTERTDRAVVYVISTGKGTEIIGWSVAPEKITQDLNTLRNGRQLDEVA